MSWGGNSAKVLHIGQGEEGEYVLADEKGLIEEGYILVNYPMAEARGFLACLL